MRLDRETRMTISVLAKQGQGKRAIAQMLGVDEKAVRYHLQRQAEGAVDGPTGVWGSGPRPGIVPRSRQTRPPSSSL